MNVNCTALSCTLIPSSDVSVGQLTQSAKSTGKLKIRDNMLQGI